MNDEQKSPAQTTGLPEDFWTLGEIALGNDASADALKLIHAEIVSRLHNEAPDADTLELMLMERVAFLYIYIRAKEGRQLFAHDRAYKETLQLWTAMAADLRKQRIRGDVLAQVRAEVVGEISGAVQQAIKTFDPVVQKQMLKELSKSLGG